VTLRRQQVGKAGEEAARGYLEERGYRVVDTNFRCLYGEIDIIALRGGRLIFVEVRTRTGSSFGTPAESITPEKLGRLRKSAIYYMKSRYGREISCRFDLIAIKMKRESLATTALRHYRGIIG